MQGTIGVVAKPATPTAGHERLLDDSDESVCCFHLGVQRASKHPGAGLQDIFSFAKDIPGTRVLGDDSSALRERVVPYLCWFNENKVKGSRGAPTVT